MSVRVLLVDDQSLIRAGFRMILEAEEGIEVVDSGAGRPARAAVEGHGLIGMRERAHLYGGEFSAGPDEGGGFRVRARLPVPA